MKRAPVAQQPTGFRGQFDRVFPPFSVQRYVVIWLGGMVVFLVLLFVLLRPSLGGNNAGTPAITPTAAASSNPTVGAAAATGAGATHDCQAPAAAGKYFVIDTVKGCIVAKLYTDASAKIPNVLANFEQKANSHFFDGLIFHRVEDWVIQGGDPAGTGAGGGQIPSEYNDLPFKVGALGVARTGDPTHDSDSQFFIVKTAADYLDSQYTNMGEVVSGMDVVNQIAIGDKMNKVTVVEKK